MDYIIHEKKEEKKVLIEFIAKTNQWTWDYNYDQLGWIKTVNGKKCSWLLLYLGDRGYVPLDLLTDMYKIIQRLRPDNEIDWEESFLIAANQRFLDECIKEKVREHLNTVHTES